MTSPTDESAYNQPDDPAFYDEQIPAGIVSVHDDGVVNVKPMPAERAVSRSVFVLGGTGINLVGESYERMRIVLVASAAVSIGDSIAQVTNDALLQGAAGAAYNCFRLPANVPVTLSHRQAIFVGSDAVAPLGATVSYIAEYRDA